MFNKKIYLEERSEPNLIRELYPYDEVPKIVFDNVTVPQSLPEDIWITDTTFRDGQQSHPPYTVKQIVEIFTFLNRLSGPSGVIKQSEFFVYSNKDKESILKCKELGFKYPEITGWIRGNIEELKLVKEVGIKETGILTSISDYHIFLKLNMNRGKAIEKYLSVVKEALNCGIRPRCHLEDITRADIFGVVIPYVLELMKLSPQIKLRLCDTMGFGMPFSEVMLPRSIPKLFYILKKETGISSENLEWHGHNDFYNVIINSVSAWMYGCSATNGTLLGTGERTGNAPIEALIIQLLSIKGNKYNINTQVISEIANYYRETLGFSIPDKQPYVGLQFNATAAGIHADGVIKDPEIYTIFNTEKILNQSVKVLVTDKSGAAGIALWINTYLGLKGEAMIDKRHPQIQKIHEWVMKEYEEGRVIDISEKELCEQAHKYFPEIFKSIFDELVEKVREKSERLILQVAQRPELKNMNKELQEKYLQEVIDNNLFIQLIAVTDRGGKRLTENITQIADRPKYEKFTKDDFSNSEWFIKPMTDGKVHVTGFYISKITGALCITVSVPIFDEKDAIVGILAFDTKFEEAVKL